MKLSNFLVTLGGAIANTRVARNLSNLDVNDVLRIFGLAGRQSHFGQGVLLFSGGAVVGAGVALLFAPASGQETRKALGGRLEKVGDTASSTLRDLQEVPALFARVPKAMDLKEGSAWGLPL